MSTEELHELHEHAEHAKHNPSLAPVSVTMARGVVLVAIVSLLGHRAATVGGAQSGEGFGPVGLFPGEEYSRT